MQSNNVNGLFGIGIDCEEIARFKKLNPRFFSNVFTQREIKYCNSFLNPYEHYAVRYAAKEAIIKSLSKYKIKLFFNQIEIINDKLGAPKVKFKYDDLNKKFKVYLSLTHDKYNAIAFTVLIKNGK